MIFDGLMRATTYMEHRRIPELYCGFRRRPGRGPTLYPAACSPQAWAAGAPFLMLQAMLGLEFDFEARRVVLVDPCLPASAGRITVRNLALGDARIDFAVCQDGEGVSVQVLRTIGDLQISMLFDAKRRSERLGRAHGQGSAQLAASAQPRSLHLLQRSVHFVEQVVVRLSNGALRYQSLKSGLLLSDADLKVLKLLLDP